MEDETTAVRLSGDAQREFWQQAFCAALAGIASAGGTEGLQAFPPEGYAAGAAKIADAAMAEYLQRTER